MNWPADFINKVICGDCLDVMRDWPDGVIQTCITSPPYWGLRDYGVEGQLGLEPTPEEYVAKMVEVFREVRRVLRDDGTLWLNLGDSYANDAKWGGKTGGKQSYLPDNDIRGCGRGKRKTGLKPKDLVGIPWMVAFALRADGWYLRSDIIWSKPNPMPESVTDRPTKAHEYLFLLAKSQKYYYDVEAIAEDLAVPPHAPGNRKLDASRNDHDQMEKVWGSSGKRNKRSVWTIATQPFSQAHFATFPEKLIERCILAGSPEGRIVLDPFFGSGTTGKRAKELGRKWIGIDLSEEYCKMARQRVCQQEIFRPNLI